MKKVMVLFVALLAVSLSAGFANAEGNSTKGKYLYRNIYKDCSARGEIPSSTPIVSPSDKTQSQWERTFEKKKFDVFGCTTEFNNLTEANLENIYTYLHGHAADSPTPAKCK
ncbi:MAG: cytochrome c family protein [Nitrospinota bacterium]|nr:cytochrome c family protein [Nitrospinota bacterium]